MNTTLIKKICIVTVFDRHYKEAGKTLLNSIRRHTDCTGIHFKVITDDEEVLNELGKENCHFITKEIKNQYSNVKYGPGFSTEYISSWYRYEIFNMIEYDRVICIDSDCICVEDISYLFSEELNQYDLISVEDYIISNLTSKSIPELERQGLHKLGERKSEGKIDIQPALLVVNKSIIKEEWYKKLLNYANTTPFSYAIDEGILNDFIYIENLKIKILPLEWDYQDLYAVHCPRVPIPNQPIIIHCQESKPFKKQKSQVNERLHKWYDMWWEENKPIIKLDNTIVVNSILDDMAINHKSDKSSRFHNYAAKYDKILSPYRESFLSVLEIGVAQGQSIRMWTDYFTKATIHGADISKLSEICESYSNRIKFHLIDQRNDAQLKSLEQFSPFDLIIDDGNHFWMEQILTFKTLFPYIRKGGMYIVEDTTTSYWEEYKNNPISPVEFFKTLIDEVHLNGAKGSIPVNPPEEFGDWEKGWHRREDCYKLLPLFESIQFMNGFIVIYKR
jgi:lipopolysaccharide biosynthesis glycosyltransferase